MHKKKVFRKSVLGRGGVWRRKCSGRYFFEKRRAERAEKNFGLLRKILTGPAPPHASNGAHLQPTTWLAALLLPRRARGSQVEMGLLQRVLQASSLCKSLPGPARRQHQPAPACSVDPCPAAKLFPPFRCCLCAAIRTVHAPGSSLTLRNHSLDDPTGIIRKGARRRRARKILENCP